MTVQSLAKKLRNAADALDDLFTSKSNETSKTAKKIRKKLRWNQKPENKAKVMRSIKRMLKAKKAK